jgi:hypothetical protein
MAVVLGALIFATLAGGLSMLMAIPLMFVLLGVGIVKEGRAIKRAAALAAPVPMPAGIPAVAAEPERPRTMTAGRRPRTV